MDTAHGPIASNYDDLQGLPSLREAQRALGADRTTPNFVCGVLSQCLEILLLNLNDLLVRAAEDLNRSDLPACHYKLEWACDFSRVVSRILAQQIQLARLYPGVSRGGTLDDSPAMSDLMLSIASFEAAVRRATPKILQVLSEGDSQELRLLDTYLVLSHEMSMWTNSLRQWNDLPCGPPQETPDYPDLRAAVFDPRLSGDTFFMQFRACHQVPELLVWSANDLYLLAIQDAWTGDTVEACDRLSYGNDLLELAIAATYPVVANLTMDHYHRIRGNLGKTSGSHSHAIHVVLLSAIQNDIVHLEASLNRNDPVKRLLKRLCGQFLSKTQMWRDMHSLLPKRNLGARGTKSLIGSPEAVATVELMRQRSLPAERPGSRFVSFMAGPGRLQEELLAGLGEMTNSRFEEVQTRTGQFASQAKDK